MSVDTRSPELASGSQRSERVITIAASLVIAVVIGLLFGLLSMKLAVAVVIGAAALVVFGRLALTHFEGLVLGVLAVRSMMDSQSLHGNANGNVSSPGSSPAAALAIGFMVASIVWLVAQHTARVQAGRPAVPMHSMVRLPAVALVLAGFASLLTSSARTTSLAEAIRMSAAITMLIVLERLMLDLANIRKILVAVFASAIVPLIFAALQTVSGGGRLIGTYSRIQGTFDHPNPFAIYLTFLVIMGAALFRHATASQKLPMAVILAACWVFLLLTYTRSAWISAAAGVLVVCLLQNKRLAIVLVSIMVFVGLVIPTVSARFSDLGHTQYSGQAGNSLSWRFLYWQELLPLANHSPITGIGLKVIELQTSAAKNAHDDFLRTYVEMGVLGLLAYCALLVGLCRTALRALKVTSTGLPRGIAVGFAGLMVAFLLLSTVSNIISQNVLLWYFFAFASAATAVVHHARTYSPAELDELTRAPRVSSSAP